MRHTDCEVNSVFGTTAVAWEPEYKYKLRKGRCLCTSTRIRICIMRVTHVSAIEVIYKNCTGH